MLNSGTIDISADPTRAAAFFEAFAPSEEESEAELQRILQASRLSGMEVVFDLTMFGDEWSPVFLYPKREPIAWVSSSGERQNGPCRP